jgi:pyruvate dehydrogenase E2 component (dihydrolipoamide acetyltransferase)
LSVVETDLENEHMATTVQMPQLGETVTSGTIIAWMKSVGDEVAIGDILVEISTDKVDTELPSEVAGTLLEILVPVGETVEVGASLCIIAEAGQEPLLEPSNRPVEASTTPVNVPEPPREAAEAPPLVIPAAAIEPVSDVGRFVSPVVRRLAREHSLDLEAVTGTGQNGRVTRRDLEAYLENAQQSSSPAPVAAEAAPSVQTPEAAPTAVPAAVEEVPLQPVAATKEPSATAPEAPTPVAAPANTPAGLEPLSRMRQVVATNMVKSVQTSVNTFTAIEVDFEAVERVRSAHKAAFKAANGRSLTYLPFVVRAVLDALKAFPVVNSSLLLEDKQRIVHPHFNIGIAVDLDGEGLVVPVIKGADNLRLSGIAAKVFELADGARAGTLGIDDYSGSTFSITNNGAHGSFVTSAIINQPNTAILSTDGVSKRPTVVTSSSGDDFIAIHHLGMLGFTWDHRAFDGAVAGQFLARVRDNLETWAWEQELL